VLTLKRSILTEKVARRGYRLSRKYAMDPERANQGMPSLTLRALRFQLLLYRYEDPLEG
jgi:hypothetical protein